ncbi:MAG: hypothetical protein GXP62_17640 [Oligoflexia bacterium]|nr:hypothetical protein [Oligoflexia bacterium]
MQADLGPLALLGLFALASCQPANTGKQPATTGATGGTSPTTTDGGGTVTGDTGTDAGTAGDGGTDTGTQVLPGQTVYINEFMADNARILQDESGEFVDWVELFNAGDEDVDLAGWTITDDLSQPDKHVLGDLLLPAGGLLVLYADGDTDYGVLHLGFSLHADGEELGIYDPDGRPIDLLSYDSQLQDVSAARAWDGSATWSMGWPATPGTSNGAGDPEPDDDAAIENVPASVWDDSALFSDDVLPHFDLELSAESIAALEASPYDYVQGTLIYDGTRYEPIGVRTKGQNSWESITEKPSLKIKLDKYVDGPGQLLGHTDLTLQNMDNDYSMMHERVAYRLYRALGIPAARATHATLSINGEPYGLYTHLETVNQQMVARWFDDSDGTLFEQWDVDYYDSYIPSFQLEYGPDDRTDLQGLADAMEQSDPGTAVLAGSEFLSWDSFRAYWAAGAVVGQFDAYPYSSPGDDCHVYDDPTSGVLHYIPHGMDETFYYSTYNVESTANGILAATCRQDADCRDAWVASIDDALDVADRTALYDYAVFVRDQIADLVPADTHKPYDDATVAYYQDDMLSFMADRRAELSRQVGTAP